MGGPADPKLQWISGGGIMKVRFAVGMAATLFAGALAMAAMAHGPAGFQTASAGVKGANDKAGECTTSASRNMARSTSS